MNNETETESENVLVKQPGPACPSLQSQRYSSPGSDVHTEDQTGEHGLELQACPPAHQQQHSIIPHIMVLAGPTLTVCASL